MKFNVGDIVYFSSVYTAIYGKQGGSYDYHFKPGDRYQINTMYGNTTMETFSITNLEDGTSHFAHSSIVKKLVSLDEWRKMQLNKILDGEIS